MNNYDEISLMMCDTDQLVQYIMELRKRDQEAMELTMNQNHRFMDQLEEQLNEFTIDIERLTTRLKKAQQENKKLQQKNEDLRNPEQRFCDQYIFPVIDDDNASIKFFKIIGRTDTKYQVMELPRNLIQEQSYLSGNDYTKTWKAPKDTYDAQWIKHKNISKYEAHKSITQEPYRKDTTTEYIVKKTY